MPQIGNRIIDIIEGNPGTFNKLSQIKINIKKKLFFVQFLN